VSGWPPPQSNGSSPRREPHPAGTLPWLALASAFGLLGGAVFLPWIRWAFSVEAISNVSFTEKLWNLVMGGGATEMGAGWMQLVALGIGLAIFGSVVELVFRPPGRLARALGLGGFAVAVAGCCLGLVIGVTVAGGTSPVLPSMTASLDVGFWGDLALSLVGVVLSVMILTAPPNAARTPLPFAPSPWGTPPGIMPPGFYPSSEDGWAEYVTRGELPPGYVPPSYGPPVMPTPGYMTPAYMRSGGQAPGWGSPFSPTDLDQTGFAAGLDLKEASMSGESGGADPRPVPGHLIVVEAGQSTPLTVEPGKRLLVGRDPDAEIRVSDRKVSERHATIERRGNGWAVQDVDAVNPTRLIDPWGMNRLVRGEMEIPCGQLVIGDVLITLYPTSSFGRS
jgi:hypothetical protein